MSKIALSLVMIASVGAIVIGATGAYFSDTEASVGNTFTAGTLDLNIEGDNVNTIMFTVADLAPGSSGFGKVVLDNVGNMDGFLDISFLNLISDDMLCNDPESDVDSTCSDAEGELLENLDVLACIDDGDDICGGAGDTEVYNGKANLMGIDELADYALTKGSSVVFRLEWSIDSSVGNIIQSDTAGFDIEFELAQTAGQ
ncbi:MAG: TasA family protein [Patescibacteria group bacterium]